MPVQPDFWITKGPKHWVMKTDHPVKMTRAAEITEALLPGLRLRVTRDTYVSGSRHEADIALVLQCAATFAGYTVEGFTFNPEQARELSAAIARWQARTRQLA